MQHGAGYFVPPFRDWVWHLGCQAWQQAYLLAESSHWLE